MNKSFFFPIITLWTDSKYSVHKKEIFPSLTERQLFDQITIASLLWPRPFQFIQPITDPVSTPTTNHSEDALLLPQRLFVKPLPCVANVSTRLSVTVMVAPFVQPISIIVTCTINYLDVTQFQTSFQCIYAFYRFVWDQLWIKIDLRASWAALRCPKHAVVLEERGVVSVSYVSLDV